MSSTLTIILVASGGALGAVLRYLVSSSVQKSFIGTFPYGTLSVNLLGALLMGVLFAYFQHHSSLHDYYKTFLITGLLGAFTTYSTFAMESVLLLQSGEYSKALLSMTLNLLGSILFAALGYITILQLGK
jgi:CrcB protein